MKSFFKGLVAFLGVLALTGCDLDEELNSDLTAEQAQQLLEESADVSSLLLNSYRGLRGVFSTQDVIFAAQEHTSDELIGPTRGPDWDDNGVWRVLHEHKWGAENPRLESAFNGLLGVVFSTSNILTFEAIASAQELAEARFLRAVAIYTIADGWGKVPVREGETAENLLLPPTVLSGSDAIQFVIDELEAILPDLPDGPATVANKDAARGYLMRALLNQGIIGGKFNADGTAINDAAANLSDGANFNPAEFFPAANLTRVVELAEQIESSSRGYTLSADYFSNFAPDNDLLSTENIFTGENIGGSNSANVRFQWFCTLHYNQNPSGWNGFTTLGDFYDKFEEADARVGGPYAGQTEVGGINVGFLIGQQFDQDGNPLSDRKDGPLSFTKDIDVNESDPATLEVRGIRVIKYPIDYNNGDNVNNDYVYLRFADVRLMKAEAILRGASSSETALGIVNELRQARGASALGSLDLDGLLDERGRELYWEGIRRTDQIRFGKFIATTWKDKGVSESFRMLFPIPATAVAVNPNLDQNPGY